MMKNKELCYIHFLARGKSKNYMFCIYEEKEFSEPLLYYTFTPPIHLYIIPSSFHYIFIHTHILTLRVKIQRKRNGERESGVEKNREQDQQTSDFF